MNRSAKQRGIRTSALSERARPRAQQLAVDYSTRMPVEDSRVPGIAAPGTGALRSAFTLIEIMVVTVLLSVIIIGLVAMFAQTQKAFRASMTQVDILEGGRAVTELITRDVEQMTPAHSYFTVNFFTATTNLPRLVQPITGNPSTPGRANLLEQFFFVARENQNWKGYGYSITNLGDGLVTLYRYETNLPVGDDPSRLYESYRVARLDPENAPYGNMNRLLSGVVHFRVRAFDITNGWQWFGYSSNILYFPTISGGQEYDALFYTNNAVPAAVEIELGVLEERSRERAFAIPAGTARSNYLAQQSSKVHLFRIRVPVRNVDPSAYQ